jgi:hypothetical protein
MIRAPYYLTPAELGKVLSDGSRRAYGKLLDHRRPDVGLSSSATYKTHVSELRRRVARYCPPTMYPILLARLRAVGWQVHPLRVPFQGSVVPLEVWVPAAVRPGFPILFRQVVERIGAK